MGQQCSKGAGRKLLEILMDCEQLGGNFFVFKPRSPDERLADEGGQCTDCAQPIRTQPYVRSS
jgi:hypothetical protein